MAEVTDLWDSQSNSCRGCGALNDTPCDSTCPGSPDYQSPEERLEDAEARVADLEALLASERLQHDETRGYRQRAEERVRELVAELRVAWEDDCNCSPNHMHDCPAYRSPAPEGAKPAEQCAKGCWAKGASDPKAHAVHCPNSEFASPPSPAQAVCVCGHVRSQPDGGMHCPRCGRFFVSPFESPLPAQAELSDQSPLTRQEGMFKHVDLEALYRQDIKNGLRAGMTERVAQLHAERARGKRAERIVDAVRALPDYFANRATEVFSVPGESGSMAYRDAVDHVNEALSMQLGPQPPAAPGTPLTVDARARSLGVFADVLDRVSTACKQANAGERHDDPAYQRHFTCLAIENVARAVVLLADELERAQKGGG